jgi:hypothetical protein
MTLSAVIKPGTVFTDWTYLEEAGSTNQQRYGLCRCVCGIERRVLKRMLLNGKTAGCGCRRNLETKARLTKHGEAGSELHQLWKRLNTRCYNTRHPDYPAWGGRGIQVAQEWRNDYAAFAAYVRANLGERPGPGWSLDRQENDKGYAPGNIRWATQETQSNNTRANRIITYGGLTMGLPAWAIETGINYSTLHTRLYRKGWSVERALTSGVKK